MKINYISLCSGYGAECIAFKRLKRDFGERFDFDCLAWAEIEPAAIKAHDAIHSEYAGRNLNDITKVDWAEWYESIGRPHVDMIFASTPCQSVSNAGKNEGMKKGTDAASALIWATEQCIATILPDIIIYENVKGLISKKNLPDFLEFAATIEKYGYKLKYEVLNAKDYGVPQNRERVFPIFFRDFARCDAYRYPAKIPLAKCVEDYMEPAEEIGESYFIDQKRVTDKTLSDILDQPNVRAEMEKLYRDEFIERYGDDYSEWPISIIRETEWMFDSIGSFSTYKAYPKGHDARDCAPGDGYEVNIVLRVKSARIIGISSEYIRSTLTLTRKVGLLSEVTKESVAEMFSEYEILNIDELVSAIKSLLDATGGH